MKIRGFLALLILTVVVVYFIFFAKAGKETNIEGQVDAYDRMRTRVTQTNMGTLEKGIELFLGTHGRLPEDLKEFHAARLLSAETVDGWGRLLRYEKLSDTNYKLTSAGQDGVFDTEDDIDLER